jgi:decaprenyl-phosphate phosphoribosyltransferase
MHHWTKNAFVLMPLFFAARLHEPLLFWSGFWAFLSMSLVCSAVYILNDSLDKDLDRQHPRKRHRPLASGAIGQRAAVVVMVLCFVVGMFILFRLGWLPLLLALAYFLLNVAYSLLLKHIAIVDVALIGLGFLLRIYLGGAATGMFVSNWLTVLTFILALILGFAKRRGEYIIRTEDMPVRRALEGYNLLFLNAAISITATVSIVAYLMYCFSPEVTQRIGSDRIYFTGLFVVLGLFRLLQMLFVEERTDSPARLLWEDRFLQLVLLFWVGSFVVLLYL